MSSLHIVKSQRNIIAKNSTCTYINYFTYAINFSHTLYNVYYMPIPFSSSIQSCWLHCFFVVFVVILVCRYEEDCLIQSEWAKAKATGKNAKRNPNSSNVTWICVTMLSYTWLFSWLILLRGSCSSSTCVYTLIKSNFHFKCGWGKNAHTLSRDSEQVRGKASSYIFGHFSSLFSVLHSISNRFFLLFVCAWFTCNRLYFTKFMRFICPPKLWCT